jgi:hypothetical protein
MVELTPEQIKKLGLEDKVQVFTTENGVVDKDGNALNLDYRGVGEVKVGSYGTLKSEGYDPYVGGRSYSQIPTGEICQRTNFKLEFTHFSLGNFHPSGYWDEPRHQYESSDTIPIAYFKQK